MVIHVGIAWGSVVIQVGIAEVRVVIQVRESGAMVVNQIVGNGRRFHTGRRAAIHVDMEVSKR